MSFYKNNEIDFILTHPPYVDMKKYSEGKIAEDLSGIHDAQAFVDEIEKVAKELYRVLRNMESAVLYFNGDTRRSKSVSASCF